MEWVELFCTFGNEMMIIVNETKVASEIRFLGGIVESPAQPEHIQEVVGGQRLRCDGRGRRVPCSQIQFCQVR